MKEKNRDLVINLTCTRDELLSRLKNYKHKHDYIRVSNHDDFDICLELTWQQHSNPFVEYYYLANVVDNKVIGKIHDKESKKEQDKKIKWTLKENLEILGFLLLGLAFIYGVPFAIVYAISDDVYLSLGLGAIPLLGYIIIVSVCSNHISTHKKNIVQMIKDLLMI